MTDSTQTALITAAPPTLIALLSWWSSRRNGKNIQEVKVSIDGRMEELLRYAKGEATATGHAAGMAEEKAKSA